MKTNIIKINLLLLFIFLSPFVYPQTDLSPEILSQKRQKMVKTQIEKRGISDIRVLNAMLKVERHRFIPLSLLDQAYDDTPLPIGENQTISQPYIVALMTQLLMLEKNHKVLEIGTGSGYQAAILAELADSVFTIEIVPSLTERAKNILDTLGYKNIVVKTGDGYQGWEEHAPYDAIIVTCAPPEIPQPLLNQLADSGRMVIPVGSLWQELLLLKKTDKGIIKKEITPVLFVPMTGEAQKK